MYLAYIGALQIFPERMQEGMSGCQGLAASGHEQQDGFAGSLAMAVFLMP